MAPKDFDIPDIPDIPGLDDDEPAGGRRRSGGGTGRKRPRRWTWLVAGLVLGVLGTVFLPDLVRPHLPPLLRGKATRVQGLVVGKGRDGDRLLLTVDTPQGAMLATFQKRVPEIDLLVASGDSVTLGVAAYRPFVEGPELLGVRKPGQSGGRPGGAAATGASDSTADSASGDSGAVAAPPGGTPPASDTSGPKPDSSGDATG